MHSNIILEPRLEQLEQFAVSWDRDCSIPEPEPAAEEPERRRSRRLSGEQSNQNDDTEDLTELPRRVFVDETEGFDDDLFGDPGSDLAVDADSEDDEA